MNQIAPDCTAFTAEDRELMERSTKLERRLKRVHALSNFLRRLPLPKRERWARCM